LKLSSHELCAVVGRVASGKSTICSTILNETFIHSGTMRINSESIAYASQTPWILNATIRDNIIFGLPINEARYEKVLNICQLLTATNANIMIKPNWTHTQMLLSSGLIVVLYIKPVYIMLEDTYFSM